MAVIDKATVSLFATFNTLPLHCTCTYIWLHLLTGQFLSSCAGGGLTPGLGLTVGLETHGYVTGDTPPPFVVVGKCACVQLQTPLPGLVKFDLPSPDWTATRGLVARHFPAGCTGCGVWVRMVEGCSEEHVMEVMEVLCRKTDIQVCHNFTQKCISVYVAYNFFSGDWEKQFTPGGGHAHHC